MRTFRQAIVLGVVITILMMVLAFFADMLGCGFMSKVLFWQSIIFQNNDFFIDNGYLDPPLRDGTPMVVVTVLKEVLLGVIVYSVIALFILIWRRKG